jgi:acyl-CoA thioesterase-1
MMSRRTFTTASAAALSLRTAAEDAPASPPASPVASPDERMQQAAFQVRYQHPEKLYYYFPTFQEDAALGPLFGLDAETYRGIRTDFDTQVHHTAMDLLADPAFADRVAALPFAPGAIILGIGESDMDDLLSAFEILRHLVTMHRPDDAITFINMGISGQTTTEALGRIVGYLLTFTPTHILCGLGANDAFRYDGGATKTRVSIAETTANFAALRHLAAANGADWTWLTRWTVDPERIAAYPPFQMTGTTVTVEDWNAVSAAVRAQEGTVVDLEPVFGASPGDLLEFDGFHPSPAGQKELARAIVESLTT